AGREIGLTQSSMSHALARLRAHFCDPLLVPVGRELVLTERARALLEPVGEAVARLENVFERAAPFDPRTGRRRVRLPAGAEADSYVLPQLAATVTVAAPGVELRVSTLPEDWIGALQRGDLDLALVRRQPLPDTVEGEALGHEPFDCVVRAGHAVRTRPSLR